MLALFRYSLLKELKHLPIILLIIIITIAVSFLENISEITLLMLLLISTGLYLGNEQENLNFIVFQKIIPVSIFNQLKIFYLVLIFRTIIAMTIYVLAYFLINQSLDITIILQLATFFSTSLSMGSVVIYKNIMENQMKKISYYLTLILISILPLITDVLDIFVNLEITNKITVGITVCLNLIFVLSYFVYSLSKVKKFRRRRYVEYTL